MSGWGFRIARSVALVATVASCVVFATARATNASVIEVNSDGTTETFGGPVIATADGITPIAAPAAPSRTLAPVAHAPQLTGVMGTAAERFQIGEQLIEAVAWAESRFNQRARSPKGAVGIMQLMPATSRDLGVSADDLPDNIDGGAHYLALLLRSYDGDLIRTLSAYNAGPEAVARYGGEPPFAETRAFVDAVLGRLAEMSEYSPSPTEAAR